jgi:outer membrane protein assembly factor BamB
MTPRTAIRALPLLLAAALTGCMSQQGLQTIGNGIEKQFQAKGQEIEKGIQSIGNALVRSGSHAKQRFETLQTRVVDKYKAAHRPRRLVFFAEDAAPPAAKAAKPARERAFGEPITAPAKDIPAQVVSERTLQHRGLRVLWKLGLDGSGVRYADLDGGYLYVVTKKHRFYSIESNTGLTRWMVDLRSRPDSRPGFNDLYAVISAGDVVRVIDKRSGRAKWRFETGVLPASRPFCTSLYFLYGCWDGDVCAFRFGDRFPRWRFNAGNRVFGAPFLRGGTAFAAADDGAFTKYNATLRLVSKEIQLGGRPVGDLVGSKTLVYCGTENFEMVAVRVSDGTKGWTHGCNGRVQAGPWLSATGNVLYYSARQDGLYALTAATGKKRWMFPGGIKPVAAAGDRLFVLRNDGALCSVEQGTGKLLWAEPIKPFADVVGHLEGKILYLLTTDGQIYAVAPRD